MKKLFLGLVWALFFVNQVFAGEIVSNIYPNLDLVVLRWAKPVELKDKLILKAGDILYTEEKLIKEIKNRYPGLDEDIKGGLLFFLEDIIGKDLLIQSARKEGKVAENQEEAIMIFLFDKVKDIQITDQEVKDFYDKNLASIKEMPYEKIKDQLKLYLLNEKRKEKVRLFLANFGKDKDIQIDTQWLKEHAAKLLDNPLDKARSNGKVTFVQFATPTCEICVKMEPFIKDLAEKNKGRRNIVLVDVSKNRLLATRYAIDMVPIQVFYDNKGKEVFRHMGFYSKEQIEKKLAEIDKE